jgi:hypothetical protein
MSFVEQITKEWLESIFTEVHYVTYNTNRMVWLHLLDENFEKYWKNSYAIAYVGVDPEGNLIISKWRTEEHEYPTMSLEIVCKNKRFHLNGANN